MSLLLSNPQKNTIMSHSLDLEKLCHECVDIARDAGKAILKIYDAGFNVEEKDDKKKGKKKTSA
jgi:hypothetical protein